MPLSPATSREGGGGGGFDPDTEMPWYLEWPGLDPFGNCAVARTGWATVHTASDGSVQLSIGSTAQGGGMQYGGTAQNDSVEWDIVLAAGTWTIQFECVKFSDCGIVTISVDGSDVGTIDTYAAGATYNQIVSLANIVIASTGKKRIKFMIATKNASSSGFVFRGQTRLPIRMMRTA